VRPEPRKGDPSRFALAEERHRRGTASDADDGSPCPPASSPSGAEPRAGRAGEQRRRRLESSTCAPANTRRTRRSACRSADSRGRGRSVPPVPKAGGLHHRPRASEGQDGVHHPWRPSRGIGVATSGPPPHHAPDALTAPHADERGRAQRRRRSLRSRRRPSGRDPGPRFGPGPDHPTALMQTGRADSGGLG
jgi:hypothetical protein